MGELQAAEVQTAGLLLQASEAARLAAEVEAEAEAEAEAKAEAEAAARAAEAEAEAAAAAAEAEAEARAAEEASAAEATRLALEAEAAEAAEAARIAVEAQSATAEEAQRAAEVAAATAEKAAAEAEVLRGEAGAAALAAARREEALLAQLTSVRVEMDGLKEALERSEVQRVALAAVLPDEMEAQARAARASSCLSASALRGHLMSAFTHASSISPASRARTPQHRRGQR